MVLRASQFDSLLTPIIYHHLDVGMSRVPAMRSQLFNVQPSNLSEEKGTGMGAMSVDAWDAYKSSGKKGRLDHDQLYTQTYTHVEYPVELVVEKKLLQFDQYGQINQFLQRAGLSAATKKEVDAASLLNNAFASGTTWSDSKPLCSASHPKGPNTTGTYSNRVTTALTAANLSAARTLMQRFKDDKGNELGLMPNELWVPPELEDTALQIVNALGLAGTANNDANPQAGRWTVKPWLRLSDANNWFIADGVWRQMAANWYDVSEMEIMLVHESTTELVYEIKLFYSFGVDDWRWILGAEVS